MLRILLCLWLAVPMMVLSQTPQTNELTLIGAQRLLNKSYNEAIIALDRAIKLNPNNWVAYEFRAQAHYQLDKNTLALKDLDEAIRINPSNAELYFKRGIMNELMKMYREAEMDYRRAITLSGNNYDGVDERLDAVIAYQEGGSTSTDPLLRGSMTYAPNAFDGGAFRYRTDQRQIRNWQYTSRYNPGYSPSNSSNENQPAYTPPPETDQMVAARPYSSEFYDPYENSDKDFGSREDINRNTFDAPTSVGTRGGGSNPLARSSATYYEARMASPNKRVFIEEVIRHPSYTEIRFSIKGDNRTISLPPDKIRILADGKSYFLHGSYRQRPKDFQLQNGFPAEITLQFEAIPEGTDFIRVISRGNRAIEKWDYSFRLYPRQ